MFAVLDWLAIWWWAIALGWVAMAAAVGLVVGRVIRNRDRQEPEPPTREQVEKIMQDLSESEERG